MRVVITGCSTGIGRELAVQLAARGDEVIATARNVTSLQGLPVATALPLDVTDPASVDAVRDQIGEVDVLINNAGITVVGPVEQLDIDDVRDVFETNVFALVRMCQAFAPAMRKRRSGTIVNVSSVGGRYVLPFVGAYSASKAAVEHLSIALRYELAAFGVRVLIVEPGGVTTNFAQNRRKTYGLDPDYEVLERNVTSALASRVSANMAAEQAALEIIAAIDAPNTHARVPIGDEARHRLSPEGLAGEQQRSLTLLLGDDWQQQVTGTIPID
ncbi:SDR family oxidoreductase [Rhodococcus koreensis]